jgi:hypothetical protein
MLNCTSGIRESHMLVVRSIYLLLPPSRHVDMTCDMSGSRQRMINMSLCSLTWVMEFWTSCELISKFIDLDMRFGSLGTQTTHRVKMKIRPFISLFLIGCVHRCFAEIGNDSNTFIPRTLM